MSCSSCPNCGHDLEPFRAFAIGALSVDDPQTIRWNGAKVALTVCQRIIVLALTRAGGAIMARIALAEAVGCDDRMDPDNIIAVHVHRIKKAFRAIDPAFDEIENVWGAGLRWRQEADERIAA